jgi:hypothetical protein
MKILLAVVMSMSVISSVMAAVDCSKSSEQVKCTECLKTDKMTWKEKTVGADSACIKVIDTTASQRSTACDAISDKKGEAPSATGSEAGKTGETSTLSK